MRRILLSIVACGLVCTLILSFSSCGLTSAFDEDSQESVPGIEQDLNNNVSEDDENIDQGSDNGAIEEDGITQNPDNGAVEEDGVTQNPDNGAVEEDGVTQNPDNGAVEEEEHIHSYGKWSTAKKATCTQDGAEERLCDCGTREVRGIKSLGHSEQVDKAVAPSCTSTGLTAGKHCSVCKQVLQAQKSIPALGHTEVIDKAVNATCTTSGLTDGKHCSVCKQVLQAQKVIPAAHTESEWIVDKAATCSSAGSQHKICTVCKKTLTTVTIPAAHKWINATCLNAKHCELCSKEEGSPLGHTVDDGTCQRCSTYVRSRTCDIRIVFPYEAIYKYDPTGRNPSYSWVTLTAVKETVFYGGEYLRVVLKGTVKESVQNSVFVYAYIVTPSGKTVRATASGNRYTKEFTFIFNSCSEKGTYSFWEDMDHPLFS